MNWGPLRPAGTTMVGPGGPGGAAGAADPACSGHPACTSDNRASADTLQQANQVFLAGNQLPARWARRDRFTVLDTGFGGGHKFLATWAAWQQDASRCGRLHYLAIDPYPPTRDDLAGCHAGTPVAALADALASRWPPRTPDLHVVDLDNGRVRLLLAWGDIAAVLPEWVASVDAFHLDGPAAEPDSAAWDARRLRRLPRLAAIGASLAARSTATALRNGLAAAGFDLCSHADPANLSALTAARYAPRFIPVAPPGRQALAGMHLAGVQPAGAQPASVPTVAVIGAGLAGAAVARALAAQGVSVQVFDRRDGPAGETSGNPGGLFHGIVHGHDGPHARWLRSAALRAEQVLRPLVDRGQVDGAVDGLLRGEQTLDAVGMQALLDQLALPSDYLQVHPAALPGGGPAWFYPGGGWVAPAALCAHWLAAPGITARFGTAVQVLRPQGAAWLLQGTDGQPLATVDAVVLCSAADTGRLLASRPPATVTPNNERDDDNSNDGDGGGLGLGLGQGGGGGIGQHLHTVRGQITLLPAATAALPALPLPLAATGYALRLSDGRLLCGASAQPGAPGSQDGPAEPLREADHEHNLATLRRLTGWTGSPGPGPLAGRVGWRLQSGDRLPLLGPVPAQWFRPHHTMASGPADASAPRGADREGTAAAPPDTRAATRPTDQARQVPRQPGLYMFTALGSRGITHAALGGEVLAAWITGDPVPAPASLLDALDPARFIARKARRAV